MDPKYTQSDIDTLFEELMRINRYNGDQQSLIYKTFVKLHLKPLPNWQENVTLSLEKVLADEIRDDFTLSSEEDKEDQDDCVYEKFCEWWEMYGIGGSFDVEDYEDLTLEFIVNFCKTITEKHKK